MPEPSMPEAHLPDLARQVRDIDRVMDAARSTAIRRMQSLGSALRDHAQSVRDLSAGVTVLEQQLADVLERVQALERTHEAEVSRRDRSREEFEARLREVQTAQQNAIDAQLKKATVGQEQVSFVLDGLESVRRDVKDLSVVVDALQQKFEKARVVRLGGGTMPQPQPTTDRNPLPPATV